MHGEAILSDSVHIHLYESTQVYMFSFSIYEQKINLYVAYQEHMLHILNVYILGLKVLQP